MNKQTISVAVATLVVGAATGFYGGIQFQAKKSPSLSSFQNMTPEQRQQAFGQFRGANGQVTPGGQTPRRAGGASAGNGFATGDILSKDDKSITIKMRDGSSKIVFLSGATAVGKTTTGTKDDLTVGEQVMVNRTSNSDGTLTAQSIQIRPVTQNSPQQ